MKKVNSKLHCALFFIIILLLIFFNAINVSSYTQEVDTFIIEENEGDDSLLEIKYCSIVKGEVNWGKKGKYTVTYYNERTDEMFEKTFEVIERTSDDIVEVSEEELCRVTLKDNIELEKIVYSSKESFFILAREQDTLNIDSYDSEYGVVFYYENGNLIWKYSYAYNYCGLYQGIATDEGVIVVFETYDSKTSSKTSLNILEINKDKKVLKTKRLKGEENDHLCNIYLYNDLIYLTIQTASNEYDYKEYRDSPYSQVLLLMLDYKTLEVVKKYNLGNNKESRYISIDYSEIGISVLLNMNGTAGWFVNNRETDDNKKYIGTVVVVLGYDFELYYYTFISRFNENFHEVLMQNNGVMVLFKKGYVSDGLYYLRYYDLTTKAIRDIPIEHPDGYLIKSMSFIHGTDSDLFASYITVDEGKTYDSGLIKIENHKVIFLNTERELSSISVITKEKNRIFKLTHYNDVYEIKEIVVKEIEAFSTENTSFIASYYNVWINGTFLERTPLNENEVINYKKFGYQEQLDYYVLDGVYEAVLRNSSFVKLKTNIKDKEIYHLGIKLEFNGTGYLNNEKIKSGFIIEEIGEYSLKIIGTSNETEIIYFSVYNLLEDMKEKEVIDVKVSNIEKEVTKKQFQLTNIFTNEINKDVVDEVKYLIIFVIVTFFLITSFFLYKWRKIK